MTLEPAHRDAMGLHGDFWTRLLIRLLRLFPAWLCLWMTRPFTLAFFILAAPQRRAVLANLRALRPDAGAFKRCWGGYQVFLQFALTYMDRIWSLHLCCPVRWDFQSHLPLLNLLARPGGALLFTIHSGNYDIGAMLFAQYSPRPIHVVRVPERTEALQALRSCEFKAAQDGHPQLQVHYATEDWNLGLQLCRALQNGEVVAVQGDRALSTAQPALIEQDGLVFRLPSGPLSLARAAQVPCYPVFLTRKGRCHYCLQSGPPFYDGTPGRRIDEVGLSWLAVMAPFVREHWDQWFVFESVVRRAVVPATASAGPTASASNT
jgi:lauroyl/myristoyl acyltransferase